MEVHRSWGGDNIVGVLDGRRCLQRGRPMVGVAGDRCSDFDLFNAEVFGL